MYTCTSRPRPWRYRLLEQPVAPTPFPGQRAGKKRGDNTCVREKPKASRLVSWRPHRDSKTKTHQPSSRRRRTQIVDPPVTAVLLRWTTLHRTPCSHDSVALGLPRSGHSRSLEECRGGPRCPNGSRSCLPLCCRLDVPDPMQAAHRARSRKPASKEAPARSRAHRMRAPRARPAKLAAKRAGIALSPIAPARSHGCASHDNRRDVAPPLADHPQGDRSRLVGCPEVLATPVRYRSNVLRRPNWKEVPLCVVAWVTAM